VPTSLKLKILFRSPPFQLVFVSIIAVLLLFGWKALYYDPLQSRLEALENRLAAATQKLERAKAARAALPALVNQQHNLATSLTRYEGALPEEPDPTDLLRRFATYAENAGVRLNRIEHYKASVDLKGVHPYGLRLAASASFPALVKLLAQIDGDPQFLIVDPPAFKSASDGMVTTSLQVVALYRGGTP